jgi:hypothetical protein
MNRSVLKAFLRYSPEATPKNRCIRKASLYNSNNTKQLIRSSGSQLGYLTKLATEAMQTGINGFKGTGYTAKSEQFGPIWGWGNPNL